jgi:intracellular sulfur oxidation DsrE/DsrF family protein
MTTRKEFLATGSLLAVTTPIAQAATPSPKSTPPPLTFQFDQARFNDILNKTAKHKQCFGIVKINEGSGLDGMMNSITAYDDFLKEGPGAMQAVGVLYHGAAIAFAMSDAIWNQYLIPAVPHLFASIRQDIGSPKPGAGNPYKDRVQGLVARGASFFVCHNAIAGVSGFLADSLKTSPQKVHAAIMAGIVPGALVVPAGVMAVNACQEAKFTYIAT